MHFGLFLRKLVIKLEILMANFVKNVDCERWKPHIYQHNVQPFEVFLLFYQNYSNTAQESK